MNQRALIREKPNMDLRDLPKKLTTQDKAERRRLLVGLHERFWHAAPHEMLKLLTAMLLPRDIVLEGIDVARHCPHCLKFQPKLHRPQIKGHLATHFNQVVQHDLFFLFDETFMLLIDEAIRWKTGGHLATKQGPDLIKALLNLWIRLWGPPCNILTDQEGGLVSNEATAFFSRLNITRLLVGKEGSTTKGLVERHIALTKFAILKLHSAMRSEGLPIDYDMLVQEVCMSQNLLLDYHGGTPQQALTGQYQKDWWTIEPQTLESPTSASERRP